MRYLFAFAVLVSVALLGVITIAASSSCVIDYRDPDSAIDGEAGYETGVVDAGMDVMDVYDAPNTDCGCCTKAVLPLLPGCSGKVAFEFPASDCKIPCAGSVAYALCEGECFTACACDLPADFTLIDGGFDLEGGAQTDGSPEDATKPSEGGHEGGRETGSDTGSVPDGSGGS